MEAKHTATPWRIGKSCGSVVADAPVPEMGGSDSVKYYGGHLIAESITPYNAAFIVRACNDYERLVQIERDYTWLMDCARKTGVIVTFNGDTMSVVHGTKTDVHGALVDALGDAIKTIKAMSCKDLSCDEPEDVSDLEAVFKKAGVA